MNMFVVFGVFFMCVVLEDFWLKSIDVEKRVDGEDFIFFILMIILMIIM